MRIKDKLRAGGAHLLASLGVAALAAALVYGLWYPYPYHALAGGDALFRLLVSVDVIMGPLLTLVVYNRTKPRAELWRDLAVVVALQLAALGYGLRAVYAARPVYLVYEVDRFRVISAADIDPTELAQAPGAWRTLPMHGVRVIGVRAPRDGAERLRALELGLAGYDVSMQPGWWQEIGEAHRQQMRARAKSVELLRSKATAGQRRELAQRLTEAGLSAEDVIVLPLVGRQGDWSALLARGDLRIVGYLPIDSF